MASLNDEERATVLVARVDKARTDKARDAARARFLKGFAPRRSSVAGGASLDGGGGGLSSQEGARRQTNPQRRYSAPGLSKTRKMPISAP